MWCIFCWCHFSYFVKIIYKIKLYILLINQNRLTGDSVFPGKKFNEVLKKNKECVISLEGPAYEFISKEAKDLMLKMLKKDPKERISAEEA